MRSSRILVVEDYEPLRKGMAEYLREQGDIAVVREAANGIEALQFLEKESFDVMVTDLVMPGMDGFVLLSRMQQLTLNPVPKVIVVSALSGDDFVTRAVDLGASFYMVKPFDEAYLLSHIREVCQDRSKPYATYGAEDANSRVKSLDERLGSLFLTIGIPAHIKGYQYLRHGVKMVIENPDMINRITKELYPGIAKYFGTSASKVERAIRHAIEVAWNRGRVDMLNTMFGCRVCTQEDKPTNGEFIAMIADRLGMEISA